MARWIFQKTKGNKNLRDCKLKSPSLDNSIEIFPSASGLQNPLEYIPKVPNDSFLPGLYKNPDDLLGLGNRISIFDGLPNDDNNGRYITDDVAALGLLGDRGILMAKGGKQNILPDFVHDYEILDGESGKEFATRVFDEIFGKDNYNTGASSLFNITKKVYDRKRKNQKK